MFRRPLTVLALAAVASACAAENNPLTPDASILSSAGNPAEARISGSSETIYGLTSDNSLVVFASGKANKVSAETAITGLANGEVVIGIDFRPSDLNANGINDVGKLYGVTSANRIYVIDPATGAASSPVTLTTSAMGSAIGVGFNPVPDRLRIHTTSNQNLRINVDNGAVTVDGVLVYGMGDANFGVDPSIVATGYTNNDNDLGTGTTLFAVDAATDALVTFPAGTGGPNGGVMATIGSLGLDVGDAAGFDISVTSGTGYLAVATSASGKSTLYSVDLATGSTTKLGMLAQAKSALLSIAVAP